MAPRTRAKSNRSIPKQSAKIRKPKTRTATSSSVKETRNTRHSNRNSYHAQNYFICYRQVTKPTHVPGTCHNCFDKNPYAWALDEKGNRICKACKTYYRKHKIHRPADPGERRRLAMVRYRNSWAARMARIKRGMSTPMRIPMGQPKCENCNTDRRKPCMRKTGYRHCDACHSYYEANQVQRPLDPVLRQSLQVVRMCAKSKYWRKRLQKKRLKKAMEYIAAQEQEQQANLIDNDGYDEDVDAAGNQDQFDDEILEEAAENVYAAGYEDQFDDEILEEAAENVYAAGYEDQFDDGIPEEAAENVYAAGYEDQFDNGIPEEYEAAENFDAAGNEYHFNGDRFEENVVFDYQQEQENVPLAEAEMGRPENEAVARLQNHIKEEDNEVDQRAQDYDDGSDSDVEILEPPRRVAPRAESHASSVATNQVHIKEEDTAEDTAEEEVPNNTPLEGTPEADFDYTDVFPEDEPDTYPENDDTPFIPRRSRKDNGRPGIHPFSIPIFLLKEDKYYWQGEKLPISQFFDRVERIHLDISINSSLPITVEKNLEREFHWLDDWSLPFKRKLTCAYGISLQEVVKWVRGRQKYSKANSPQLPSTPLDKMFKLLRFFDYEVPNQLYPKIQEWVGWDLDRIDEFFKRQKNNRL